ncbi:MAG TPA: GNAT family N-acetyltransferase [Solirubrobacteraceae bacterium]
MEEQLTERLRLRAWSPGDLDAYARIVADPEVMTFMGSGPVNRTTAAQQIEHYETMYAAHGTPHWVAEDRATGQLVGRIGLFHHPDWPLDPDNVEVGWLLARARWGEGLATEGARAAVAYAWRRLDTPQVISLTLPENVRSRGVMERLGMTLRGRERWRGYEHVWYALDRPDGA